MREEAQPSRPGEDIIIDRLQFATRALPKVAVLRDKYISLATELASVRKDAKHEHEKEMARQTAARRPTAAAPPPKRAASGASSSSASASRRLRAIKAWNCAKQQQQQKEDPSDTQSYISVNESEVVTLVSTVVNDDGAPDWFEVQREDGTRGCVKALMNSGVARFEEVEEEEAIPAPLASSEEEVMPAEDPDDHGAWMRDESELRESEEQTERERRAPASASPPPTTTALGDNDVTPGREEAPIKIKQSALSSWVAHEHLFYSTITEGAYKGQTVWWDGASTYKLHDGRTLLVSA
jgi:hypothetical protein